MKNMNTILKEKATRLFRLIQPLALPIPDYGTGPDDSLFYCWDKDEHHFEIEIFSHKDTEFFYRNRKTDEIWGFEYSHGELPIEVIERLSNLK